MSYNPEIGVQPGNWPPPRFVTELNRLDKGKYNRAYNHVKAIEKVNEKLPGYETGARIANQRWDLIKEEYEKMMGPCDMKGRSFPSSYSRDKKTLMDLLEVHNKNFLVNYQDP